MAQKSNTKPAAAPVNLSHADFQVLADFRYALRRFLHFSGTAAEDAGLTPQQYQALLAIKGFPGRDRMTVGELAERLLVRHHSAVGLIDRLENLKLVERRSGTRDRRETFVALSARGEAMLQGLALTHRAELRRIAPMFATLIAQVGDGA
jgi:DNA-binding MarR family transcriptional regulator